MTLGKLRKILSPLLYPISLAYGCVMAFRNKLFDLGIMKSVEFELPVISVGNITAGGTGKTPHVEYLLRLLSEKPGVAYLSRGYKRKTKGFRLADDSDTFRSIGDEPLQVYRKFRNVVVAVDEDRVHGIKDLKRANKKIRCVVLDDAFQHRRLKPGVSIVLVDYNKPLYKDYILPYGNLRESRYGISRANIVIVTKVPREFSPIDKRIWANRLHLFPYQYLYFTSLHYNNLIPLFGKLQKTISLDELKEKKNTVLLVTGIAEPALLAGYLSDYCARLKHMIYADHHAYNEADLKDIAENYFALQGENKLMITTEKDAVKLSALKITQGNLKENMFYLPVSVRFLDNKSEEFDTNICDFVEKNKGISRLHL
jgi:tetraacyldisaccharide 4'-kinase